MTCRMPFSSSIGRSLLPAMAEIRTSARMSGLW